jgi:hypothetical protein
LFGAMIVRGLLAGNPVELILQRALVGLGGGLLFGAMLGWAAFIVVSDNVPKRSEPSDPAAAGQTTV